TESLAAIEDYCDPRYPFRSAVEQSGDFFRPGAVTGRRRSHRDCRALWMEPVFLAFRFAEVGPTFFLSGRDPLARFRAEGPLLACRTGTAVRGRCFTGTALRRPSNAPSHHGFDLSNLLV